MYFVFEEGSWIKGVNRLTEEQKSRAVAVEELPEPEEIEGKEAHLRANLETQEVYHVYTDIDIDEG